MKKLKRITLSEQAEVEKINDVETDWWWGGAEGRFKGILKQIKLLIKTKTCKA